MTRAKLLPEKGNVIKQYAKNRWMKIFCLDVFKFWSGFGRLQKILCLYITPFFTHFRFKCLKISFSKANQHN